jgi:hypothetical protein
MKANFHRYVYISICMAKIPFGSSHCDFDWAHNAGSPPVDPDSADVHPRTRTPDQPTHRGS